MTNFDSSTISPGTIVLVQFPFADLTSHKKRPALVLSHTTFSATVHLFTVAMVTSKVDTHGLPGDVLLEEWQTAGLLFPSLVRLSKCVTIEDTLMLGIRGMLSPPDYTRIKKPFQTLFSAWL